MRDVKRWLSVAAFGVSVSLTGCVSSSQFKKVEAERNQLRNEIQSARAEADEFRNQLGAVSEATQGKDEQITALSSEKSELQAQLDEINKQYAEALERASNPLPKALSNELSEFASKNSDVLDFDASRGMVKFKSDVSFAPGSIELTPKAKDAITHLSKILNDQGVKGYELMIAGHTDAMPVQRAATIKQGHLDNWYLSAHPRDFRREMPAEVRREREPPGDGWLRRSTSAGEQRDRRRPGEEPPGRADHPPNQGPGGFGGMDEHRSAHGPQGQHDAL